MGAASGNQTVLIWLLILLTIFVTLQTLMVGEVSGGLFIDKTKVVMSNNMTGPLVVHCKDKTHDAGASTLNPGAARRFDIFNQLRDKCTSCIWEMFKDNLCKYTPEYGSRECFPWDPFQQEKEENVNIYTHHALIQERSEIVQNNKLGYENNM
ncbi:unnamed protein product [Lupinus luteus]|uniref:S-protein homolog n=1 Tax=Lupinus luteus TaxID=3873 RepID=A0AAV1X6I8_LUPLU